MSAGTYNFTIEKGVDFSLPMVLRRANGSYIDLTDSGVCVKSQIVEFYGMTPVTGFTITEVLPSGVILSLSEQGSSILPEPECYYDVVLNSSGVSERLVQGTITVSPNATIDILCP